MIGCVEARMKGRGRAERSLAPAEEEEEEGPVGRGDKFRGYGGAARIGIVMLLLLMSLLSPALEDGLVRFAQEDDGEV
jgi:hypothetical protein